MNTLRRFLQVSTITGFVALGMGGCPQGQDSGLLDRFDNLLNFPGGGGAGDIPGTPGDNSGNPDNNDNGDNDPQNQAPTADAGSDQTVNRGSTVNLAGTGSDPDGDALTFAWSQTGGTPVSLASATSAGTRFTAPATPQTLTFTLTTSDGNGGTDTDTVEIDVVLPPATLFVTSNGSGSRITSYGTGQIDGEIPPTTRLDAGAATGLFQARSVLVTPAGMLIATRQNGGLVIYENAFQASDDAPADRIVDGPKTLLESPIALAYDRASDTLYVGNANAEEGILAFAGVSQPSFDGDVTPTRTFAPDDRFPYSGSIEMTIDALWIGPNGALYASDTSGLNVNSSRILVWHNPAGADGEVPADREITSSVLGNIEDLAVDAGGNLYVVDGSNGIYVFDKADQLDGPVQPGATITLDATPAPQLHGVAVDEAGTGYVADRAHHAIYSLANIAAQDGATLVDTILEGFDTRLSAPRQIWIHQP